MIRKGSVMKLYPGMSDIMETNADNSPTCRSLKEVFHLN